MTTTRPGATPVSRRTSGPRWMSSRAPAGVRATRYSSDLISLATPIFMRANPTSRVDTEVGRRASSRPRSAGRAPRARRRKPDELDLLVVLLRPLGRLDVFGDVDPDELVAEARRREERCCERPVAAGEPRLLFELALRGRERLFIGLARAGGEFEQVPARGLTELADERHVPVGLEGEDRDRAGMVDDLALVLPPALHVDADQPAVEDPPRLVWPQPALLHLAGELAGEPAGGERGLEEPRVVIRTAAHVRERQPGTRPAPAGRVDLDRAREPRGRVDAGGPPHPDLAQPGLALHLTANETFVPLGDRGHRPTAEAKRHRARSPRGRR